MNTKTFVSLSSETLFYHEESVFSRIQEDIEWQNCGFKKYWEANTKMNQNQDL